MDLAFYRNLMQRGITDISHGNDMRGVNELRIAAFGLIDELPLYQTAEVYLALASDRLGRQPDARAGALKVLSAERVEPTYESLTLDPATRTAFEQLLPKLLSREQLASVPAFASLAPAAKPSQSKPHFEPVPPGKVITADKVPERPQSEVAVVPPPALTPEPPAPPARKEPVPEPRPLVSQTKPEPVAPATTSAQSAVRPKSEPVPAPGARAAEADPAAKLASQAQASYLAGDYGKARDYAEKAEAADDTNAIAHQVLGGLAVQRKNWAVAVTHYSIVRTRQRLTDDESAWFFIGLVNTSRLDDAAGVKPMLSQRVLSRPDVQRALQTLDAERAKNAPVSVAATPPGPPPAAPAAAKPQPQPTAISTPGHATTQATTPPAPPPAEHATAAASGGPPRPLAPSPSAQTRADAAKPPTQPATAPSRPNRIASAETEATPPPAPTTTRTVTHIDSPLVAAARHAPSESSLGGDVPTRIAEATRLLNEGKVLGARQIYLRLAQYPDMPRNLMLDVAKGLNQTSSWRESANAYERVYPFARGEEMHMFYQAVNLYELGSHQDAKELFRRAAPALPNTREVTLYRQKINSK